MIKAILDANHVHFQSFVSWPSQIKKRYRAVDSIADMHCTRLASLSPPTCGSLGRMHGLNVLRPKHFSKAFASASMQGCHNRGHRANRRFCLLGR
jgi:hypothetical protein